MFREIKTWANTDSTISVCWSLEPGSTIAPFSVFRVEFSRPGGAWETVGETADSCCLSDPIKRDFGVLSDSMYRVVLNQPNTNPIISGSYQAGMGFHLRRDWLHAREIVRQSYLDLYKGGGRKGNLLIRKRWGVRCTECKDFVTGNPTVSTCKTCLGTGFVGGYHPPIEYWIKTGAEKDITRNVTDIGTLAPVREQGWGVAWPRVSELDVWVDTRTSERHEITNIQSATEFVGVPLTWKFAIGKLSKADHEPTMQETISDSLVNYTPSPSSGGFEEEEWF